MADANNSTQPYYGYTLPPEEVIEETTETITPGLSEEDLVMNRLQELVAEEEATNFPGDLEAAMLRARQRAEEEFKMPPGTLTGAASSGGGRFNIGVGQPQVMQERQTQRQAAQYFRQEAETEAARLLESMPQDLKQMYALQKSRGNEAGAQRVLDEYAAVDAAAAEQGVLDEEAAKQKYRSGVEEAAKAERLRKQAEGLANQELLQGLQGIATGQGGGPLYRDSYKLFKQFSEAANSGMFSPEQREKAAIRAAEIKEEIQLLNEEMEPTPRHTPGVIGTRDYTDDQWRFEQLRTYYNDARKAAEENFKLDMSGGMGGIGTILSTIGVALGAYASGMLGGPNQALEILQKQIDRDIKRQYKKQKNKIDNLDLDFQQQTLMLDMVKKDRLELYARKLQELAAQANTEEQRQKLLSLAAQAAGVASNTQFKVNPEVALKKQLLIYNLKTGQPLDGKGSKRTADEKKLSAEQAQIRNHIKGARAAYKEAKRTTSKPGQWVASLGAEAGLYRDVVRGLGWMSKEAGTYYNKRTQAIAYVVKVLQGARPSDFDWKKLDILFPQLPDNEELADADFDAMQEVAEMTLQAEDTANEIMIREGIGLPEAFVHRDNAAGRKLEALGNALHSGGPERLANNVSGWKYEEARPMMQQQAPALHQIIRTQLGGQIVE